MKAMQARKALSTILFAGSFAEQVETCLVSAEAAINEFFDRSFPPPFLAQIEGSGDELRSSPSHTGGGSPAAGDTLFRGDAWWMKKEIEELIAKYGKQHLTHAIRKATQKEASQT